MTYQPHQTEDKALSVSQGRILKPAKAYSLREIKELCRLQADAAKAESKHTSGALFSRGRFISFTLRGRDGRLEPFFEGETRPWKGTLSDLVAAMNEVPAGTKIAHSCIFGAFDWAESVAAYQKHDDYEPQVVEWELNLEGPFV